MRTVRTDPDMADKPPLRIRVPHKLWARFGDRTLVGLYAMAVMKDHRGANAYDHGNLILEIEQTSMAYRRKNEGPAEMIVPEFLPLCLIGDVLALQEQARISVEVVEINEEPVT